MTAACPGNFRCSTRTRLKPSSVVSGVRKFNFFLGLFHLQTDFRDLLIKLGQSGIVELSA